MRVRARCPSRTPPRPTQTTGTRCRSTCAKTPRTWTGARSPSGLKRVRQAERRRDILQPRRSAAKTYVAKALSAASGPVDGTDATVALLEALSALDRAAKVGAIHPNAAARRKSRLTLAVNAALGGAQVQAGGRAAKTTGRAAAAKAAKARIAAGKADKAKGAQTAAGKARAALSRTARAEGPTATTAVTEQATEATPTRAGATKAAGSAKAAAGTKPAGAKKPASAKATGTTKAGSKATTKPAAKAAPRTSTKG
ncbi:MAG: 30S ribosomal protein S20 [Chloroflexota bacterium]